MVDDMFNVKLFGLFEIFQYYSTQKTHAVETFMSTSVLWLRV